MWLSIEHSKPVQPANTGYENTEFPWTQGTYFSSSIDFFQFCHPLQSLISISIEQGDGTSKAKKLHPFFIFHFQYCRPFPAASVRRILRYIIHFYRQHDNLRKMVLTVSFKRRVGDTPYFVTCAFHRILKHYFRGLRLPIGFFLVSNFSLDTAQEISIQDFRLNLEFSGNWRTVVRTQR